MRTRNESAPSTGASVASASRSSSPRRAARASTRASAAAEGSSSALVARARGEPQLGELVRPEVDQRRAVQAAHSQSKTRSGVAARRDVAAPEIAVDGAARHERPAERREQRSAARYDDVLACRPASRQASPASVQRPPLVLVIPRPLAGAATRPGSRAATAVLAPRGARAGRSAERIERLGDHELAPTARRRTAVLPAAWRRRAGRARSRSRIGRQHLVLGAQPPAEARLGHRLDDQARLLVAFGERGSRSPSRRPARPARTSRRAAARRSTSSPSRAASPSRSPTSAARGAERHPRRPRPAAGAASARPCGGATRPPAGSPCRRRSSAGGRPARACTTRPPRRACAAAATIAPARSR